MTRLPVELSRYLFKYPEKSGEWVILVPDIKKPSRKGRHETGNNRMDYFAVVGAAGGGVVAAGVVAASSFASSCNGAEYFSYSLFGVTIHDGFLSA